MSVSREREEAAGADETLRHSVPIERHLRKTLDNLVQSELKRFRHILLKRSGISRGKLENADTDDVLYLMEQKYADVNESAKVIVEILKDMELNQLVSELEYNLKKERTKEKSFDEVKAEVQVKLRETLKLRFSKVQNGSEDVDLEDAYADLFIVKDFSGGINSDHEVLTIDTSEIGSGDMSTDVKLEDLFKNHKKVLTQGIAGVGKTFAVLKFTMDWVDRKNNEDIEFVFPFLFRELNLKKGEHCSLNDLLLSYYPELEVLCSYTEFSRCKILFIFDGFDENRLHLDCKNCVNKMDKESSVDVIISSVINGSLLELSLTWITTRPAATKQIPRKWYNVVTEVRGFDDEQKKVFFRKNIKNQEKAERFIAYIERNRTLHIMCHIPVFCYILTVVIHKIVEVKSEKTLTEIYMLYIDSQLNRMNEKFLEGKEMSDEEKGRFLLKFGKLALSSLEEGTLIFYEKDLKRCEIDAKCGALESGVFTQIFCTETTATGRQIFSFVHFSVQEFLAALYALHEACVHHSNPFPLTRMEELNWWSRHSRFDFYKFVIERALKSQNGHLDLFVRFLFGLAPMLEPKIWPNLEALLPKLGGREECIEKITEYIKQKIREDNSPERTINLFHCLNELREQTLVQEIERYSAGENTQLSPSQCTALAYLLLMSSKDLKEFNLRKYLPTDEGLRRMIPVVKVATKVSLNQCSLTKVTGKLLASVFQAPNSRLRHLDLSNNDLKDLGVELLCNGLRNPQCQLETIRLCCDKLSLKSCEIVACVLQAPNSLIELDLSDNDLGDPGAQHLSKGLASPHCQLQKIRLSLCVISEEGCGFLASALTSNPSHLQNLDLSYNHPGELGMKKLSARVKDPHCQLRTLNVDHCEAIRLQPIKKYACDITLDPNTAHRNLSLSEGNRGASWGWRPQHPCPEHPHRFDHFSQVMSGEGLSGRHYWEVRWTSSDGDGGNCIAVAYKTMRRKGDCDASKLGYNDESWSLYCFRSGFSAWHNNKHTDISTFLNFSRTIGVYLDWPAGVLSFYRVSDTRVKRTLKHIHTFHATFTQPVHPAFRVGGGTYASILHVK